MTPIKKSSIPLLSALALGAVFSPAVKAQGYDAESGCSKGLLGREEQDLAAYMAQKPSHEWSPAALMHLRALDECQLSELEGKIGRILDNAAEEAISALSSYAGGIARGSGRSAEYADRAVKDPELYDIIDAHVSYLRGDTAGLSKPQAVRQIRQWVEDRKNSAHAGIEAVQGYASRAGGPSFPTFRQ